jgi:competence ComEA-like helix-hairpin-helix protein
MSRFRIIKEYLNLSKTEKAGIWLLLTILLAVIVLSVFLRPGSPAQKQDFSAYEKQILAWEKSVNSNEPSYQHYENDLDNPQQSIARSKITPFEFNPNELDAQGWKKLGLTDKQVKSIMNYRQKGGEFRTKADVEKMYSISAEEYNILKPYILLPETATKSTSYSSEKKQKEAVHVELNSADSTQLKTVNGIGPTFARRIIAYRSKLHGFYRVEQLKEVKGIDEEKYQQIAPYVFVNPYQVRKININTVSFDELKQHPYFGYNIALSLINYRKQHGAYAALADIKKSALITEEVYQKISPYLTIQ